MESSPKAPSPNSSLSAEAPQGPTPAEVLASKDPTGPALFINRELSWLEFDQRVLDEARNREVPLLERLKFVGIVSSNLDEFFMVRAAGLVEQRSQNILKRPPDGMTPAEQLEEIGPRVARMQREMGALILEDIMPAIEREGVALATPSELEERERERLRTYFFDQVLPILTPIAIDPGHPFPHLPNKSLNVIVMLSGEREGEPAFAVLQVPSVLPRLVAVNGRGSVATFVLLDDIIAEHAGELFRGFRNLGAWPFRVVRNFDLTIDEEEAEDLLEVIKEEVRRRDRGRVVTLTIDGRCAPEAEAMLRNATEVDDDFVFRSDAPLAIHDLSALGKALPHRDDLRDVEWTPVRSPAFPEGENIFDVMSRRDVLLHHPYESFDSVVEFVERAAADPDVLAIKQTLYRTSGDSPIVKALIRAAENGKQVAALVEIKARFDEENNINWARKLEGSGVHVVYGLVGLKTHCKVILVVRREGGRLKRYVHLGTGNYNPSTARLYTDLSFFTTRPEIGQDATALFNLLTSCTAPRDWHKLVVAPLGLHERVMGLIARETQAAAAGREARIVAKMNSLVHPEVIRALYRASQAGVEIKLIVRGICCLRPGVPGLSENIEVRSVVSRFLEHSRIFHFHAGGKKEVWASSADWMPRNFHKRVEIMFPIDDPDLKKRVIDEVLGLALVDNQKARRILPDGDFEKVMPEPGEQPLGSQVQFMRLARQSASMAAAEAKAERPFLVRPIRNRPDSETAGSAGLKVHPEPPIEAGEKTSTGNVVTPD